MAGLLHAPDGLNAAEKLLQDVSQANTFLRGIFSPDLTTGVADSNPNAVHSGILGDLASQSTRGAENLQLLIEFIQKQAHGGLVDDRNYVIEHVVNLAASFPSDSPLLKRLTSTFVQTLWQGLNHPPLSYLGDEWKYRQADGSNNTKLMPWLGRAGSSYARTVNPITQLPPNLPDSGLVFDELFARGKTTRPHPNQVSSMLFYLATIIIHDIFRTDDFDWNKVSNSSYLDLSPLYGNSDETQKAVRTMQDGKLKPDTFSEIRILGFPPGVAALLCSFNRFHNYVAEQLAEINEGGRFSLVPEDQWSRTLKETYGSPEAKRDHDLFNTARLVTSGLYINIILCDYVRTILALTETPSEWSLDPRADPSKIYGPSGIPEGIGNQVSCEFNLVYRWHSTVSPKDERWTNEFFAKFMPGKDPNTVDATDLRNAFVAFIRSSGDKPELWTFGDLKRQENGGFKDEDLVRIMQESTDDCAASFGARNVPLALKVVEKLGIEQARKWNVATLNEFRQFFGMEPHKKFTDINSDPSVAASLETLYGSPDYVELYPGLVAEESKHPVVPGSGLCPGYTVATAILADAVALVRGDRFYTVDYNAATLTNWGYTLASSNPEIVGGGVMYKLLHRAYPGWYEGNSVYAMYPFQTPTKMRDVLQKLGTIKNFSFDPPSFTPTPPPVRSYKAVTEILADHERYLVPWGHNITDMTHHDYMLGGDKPWNFQQHAFVSDAIYSPKDWKHEIRALYEKVTMEMLQRNSRQLRSGRQLDAVRDFANPSHALAVGSLFHMPIKTTNSPVNLITAPQYYTLMAVLFAYVFLDLDDGKAFELRQGALQASSVITKLTEQVVMAVKGGDFMSLARRLAEATGLAHKESDLAESYGVKLIQRMIGSQDGTSPSEVAASLVCTMAASVATQAQGLSQVIDLLLQDEYKHHWAEIRALADRNDDDAHEKLEKYALECLRLATPAYGLLRTVAAPDGVTIQDGSNGEVKLQHGDKVYVDFIRAGTDETVFPNPTEIRLDRDPKLYIHHGWGAHACIGRGIVTTALATQLACLSRCVNLRRAPGGQGQLKYVWREGTVKVYFKEDCSDFWPFPTTMKVLFDEISVGK